MEKCTATSKRTGNRCGNWPLKGYKVCKFHGARGGAKTPEGRRRQKESNVKHGWYTKEAIEERRFFRKALNDHKEAIRA